jgi:hypothetical protein
LKGRGLFLAFGGVGEVDEEVDPVVSLLPLGVVL